MVSAVDSLEDILFDEPVAGNARAGSRYRPKAKSQLGKAEPNVQLRNERPISCIETADPDSSTAGAEAPSLNASKFEGREVDHSLPRFSSGKTTLRSCSSTKINTTHDSLVSQELPNRGETEASQYCDYRADIARLEREEEAFSGMEHFHMNSQGNASPGNWDLVSEPSNFMMDNDGGNDGDDVEPRKQVQKRNLSPEGLDVSKQELRKKKFSHSTRRNRRRGDKALRETPAWEINPWKVDSQCVTASSSFIPNQSELSVEDSHCSQEDPFDSMQDQYSDENDQATSDHQMSNNTKPSERWSRRDTELFYEGIRQFGADFAMIQQLFPGRTRHQVKLKYKKEERQQPLRVHDAMTNRVKEFSHFELLIEKLKKAAPGVEHRDVEPLDRTAGEEEDLDLYREANAVTDELDQGEQVATEHGHEKEEARTKYSTQMTNDDDPFEGHECEDEENYEDCWNNYQSL